MADQDPKPLLTKNPFKLLGTLLTGFADAVGKPITDDMVRAYQLQRAARARYPGADGVLNFVPYVGVATNVDDIINDIAGGNYGSLPGDVASGAVGVKTTMMGAKGLLGAARMATSQGRSGGKVLLMGGGAPAMAYIDHYRKAQAEADKKYGDTPVLDIARRMYPTMDK